MPDLLSIGLGGGSHVELDPVKVGPLSVGYRLLKEGIAFGGRQLTTTDMAIAAGLLAIGSVYAGTRADDDALLLKIEKLEKTNGRTAHEVESARRLARTFRMQYEDRLKS